MYNIDPNIKAFFKHTMKMWITSLSFDDGSKVIKASELGKKRGIFKCYSFSAFWFCMALNTLCFETYFVRI